MNPQHTTHTPNFSSIPSQASFPAVENEGRLVPSSPVLSQLRSDITWMRLGKPANDMLGGKPEYKPEDSLKSIFRPKDNNAGTKASQFPPLSSTTAPPSSPSCPQRRGRYGRRNSEPITSLVPAYSSASSAASNSSFSSFGTCRSWSDDEKRLQEKRTSCEHRIQKLYEEREEHILELFDDQCWLLSTEIEDDEEY